jgi:hypothetical protein
MDRPIGTKGIAGIPFGRGPVHRRTRSVPGDTAKSFAASFSVINWKLSLIGCLSKALSAVIVNLPLLYMNEKCGQHELLHVARINKG